MEAGDRHGMWTLIEDATNDKFVPCRCDCGTERLVNKHNIKNGLSLSCGCTKKGNRTHGQTGSPTYRIWKAMRVRCNNPRSAAYAWYGAKGVRICERWDNYENFLADMGERPDGLSIDRIDPTGDYEPENCRWADVYTQAQNKPDTKGGVRGVYQPKGKVSWVVTISALGKKRYIGAFRDWFEAVCARKSAENRFWEHEGRKHG